MDAERRNSDVYSLVTKLSEQILQSECPGFRDSCFTQVRYARAVKKLRSNAFSILLKKTTETRNAKNNGLSEETIDPTTEILKYAFVLRMSRGQISEATSLESLLETLVTSDAEKDATVFSVLLLLTDLKDSCVEPQVKSQVFHYGKPNPVLPEMQQAAKAVPQFQTYPLESFLLSDNFAMMLGICKNYDIVENKFYEVPRNLFVLNGYNSKSTSEKRYVGTKFQLPALPDYSSNDSEIIPCLFSQSMLHNEDRREGFSFLRKELQASSMPDLCPYFGINDIDARSIVGSIKCSTYSVCDKPTSGADYLNLTWTEIDLNDSTNVNRKTWESLGETKTQLQAHFTTDTQNILIYSLTNVIPFFEEVEVQDFVESIKLVLLGIESKCFRYNETTGFSLQSYIAVYGTSIDSLSVICQDVIHWGNSYRFLSHMIQRNSETGKLQQKGLIFEAMCRSIKELLLYYQAGLSRIFSRTYASNDLFELLKTVRPIAIVISEVARLCRHNEQSEGSGILTHIYQEVTKVTDPKVALVFYSILKSCCEVYFQFLERWLFEGTCNDVYGEFMIKVHPHYLRSRNHKFWSRSFTICSESIPGFLNGITESVLQCGKTVRLLKICDPQNPVWHVYHDLRTSVKVCLSVAALREQLLKCHEYERKGEAALSPIVSFSSAIQHQRYIEKETAMLTDRRRQETLSRINKEQEERIKNQIQNKRDFFRLLKEQFQDKSTLRKENIDCDVLTPKELQRENDNSERKYLLNHYDKLTQESENRCTRSAWRIKRMKYFQERISVVTTTERNYYSDLSQIPSRSEIRENSNGNENAREEIENLTNILHNMNITQLQSPEEDENSNFTENKISDQRNRSVEITKTTSNTKHGEILKNRISNECVQNINRWNNERSTLQEILRDEALRVRTEISTESLEKPGNVSDTLKHDWKQLNDVVNRPKSLYLETIDNLTAAQNNKMKVLRQEYGVTPNNNEGGIFFVDVENNQNCIIKADCYKSENTVENCDSSSTEETEFEENLSSKSTNLSCATSQETNVVIETPSSCITDNFTTSTRSLMSRSINRSEDVTPLDVYNNENFIAFNRQLEFPQSKSMTSDLVHSTSKSMFTSLTVTDVETIDNISLHVYLEKSVIIPLRAQCRLVNRAILKYLLKEHNILSHFHSLRSYFFLLNGEFAKDLTDSLYTRLYEISVPIELFNSATLTNLLERALLNSFNGNHANSELLSLSAIDTPSQLHISDPDALSCLCLNYKVLWPLNIVLDDTVLLQYGKVFKFLLTIGRVSWVLQEDFHVMKVQKEATMSEQYHKLQLYRYSMMQFMNALRNYITCSVLHASWAEFEKDLENSLTIDQVYASHVNYVKKILSRCMLNTRGEKMRMCLYNIFKVVLKFHNRLRSESWIAKSVTYVHPNFKKLEQIYRAFCDLRMYMVHVAFKLAVSGYQPHLMQFLDALNINHLYDLTTKTY